jgi:hypothetical protein
MNRYELICLYCNNIWQINYVPKEKIYCSKCNDTNIRAIDLAKERIDQYIGCPPFPDEREGWGYGGD